MWYKLWDLTKAFIQNTVRESIDLIELTHTDTHINLFYKNKKKNNKNKNTTKNYLCGF